jgi:hypothetical protein
LIALLVLATAMLFAAPGESASGRGLTVSIHTPNTAKTEKVRL